MCYSIGVMWRSVPVLVAFSAVAASCGGAREQASAASADDLAQDVADGGIAPDAGEPPAEPPAELPAEDFGEVVMTMDVIDVGTGLAIFIRGSDFTMLFDAGSKEDLAGRKKNRVSAFLEDRHSDVETIDHVVLSHPHRDHVNLMADVFGQYSVLNVWEPGIVHQTCPYRAFIDAVSREPAVSYRSGAHDAGVRTFAFDAVECGGRKLPAVPVPVTHGPRLEAGLEVELGEGVSMKFLYVNAKDHDDPNKNSLVVRIDVGGKRILLTGDTVAGKREHPSSPPARKSAEGRLIRCCADDLASDVLVVGHHGANNASRTAFLDAIGAEVFIVSVGQASFHGFTVPHPDVMEELERRGRVFRTDARDDVCPTSALKVGPKSDGIVGGCDNLRLSVFENPAAPVRVEAYPEVL